MNKKTSSRQVQFSFKAKVNYKGAIGLLLIYGEALLLNELRDLGQNAICSCTLQFSAPKEE